MPKHIVDAHTHFWGDKKGQVTSYNKEWWNRERYGGVELKTYGDGGLQDLERSLDRAGVEKAVVLPVAGKDRVRAVNEWYREAVGSNPRFVLFGSIHPERDYREVLRRLGDEGIKGVKIHSLYQRFDPTNREAMKMYEELARLGFVALFDTFNPPDSEALTPFEIGPECVTTPRKLLDIRQTGLQVIAAHYGGLLAYERVMEVLAGQDIYFDLSFAYDTLGEEAQRKTLNLITKHGADRIIWGSDAPWKDPKEEAEKILALQNRLAPTEIENIFWGNINRLLGLSLV